MRQTIRYFFFFIVWAFWAHNGQAQVEKKITPPKEPLPLDAPVSVDTLRGYALDSARSAQDGEIKASIQYSAEDSINMNVRTKIAVLYGKAHVTYQQMVLDAENITIDYRKNTVRAEGQVDSTGRHIGYPIFKDGSETYETRSMEYNFKDKRAAITEVVTKQGDGFLHGDYIYKNENNELFCTENSYTTCNLAHPHFRILAHHTKAIPGDKMVSGPFHLEFNGVPLPLGFFFGIFPSQKQSASGIIMPTYGEEGVRGFFLRQGGFFFDINDYMKLTLTGDIYSKGSNAFNARFNYNVRYRFTGAFNFTYTTTLRPERIEDNSKSKDFSLSWTHSPQSRGTGRFTASVNIQSNSYTQNNYIGLNTNLTTGGQDQTTRNITSNISYSKTFKGTPFSMGIRAAHNQNLSTKLITTSLPDLNLNMKIIYPFAKSNILILKNFNFSYAMSSKQELTNNIGRVTSPGNPILHDSIAPFSGATIPLFFKLSKRGMKHTIPLSTNFKVLRFFTLGVSATYDEVWYLNRLRWAQESLDKNPVIADTISGFGRAASYFGAVSLNTRIYGTIIRSKPGVRIKAIRHILNPAVNFNYRPDFGEERFGYYQNFIVQSAGGRQQEVRKSIYEGYIYGAPQSGKSAGIGFSLGNTLEMKVRSPKDTVDKKISLLNSLSLSGNYNFLADSMKLSVIAISANTNVLNNKLNINFSSTLDPYKYIMERSGSDERNSPVYQERRVDQIVWKDWSPGRITNMTLTLSTSLNPKGQESKNQLRDKVLKSNAPEGDKQEVIKNIDNYIDFTIPWNLSVNYNMTYNRPLGQLSVFTHNIQFSGDISLSEKWKIQFTSGYDVKLKEFTQTRFTIARDLHCWQMNLSWVPFGRFQSYSFTIGVKSSLLRDLKVDRTRSFFDNN